MKLLKKLLARLLLGNDLAEMLYGYRPPQGKHNSLIAGSPTDWTWGKGDHGSELDGLGDDDHGQYLNNTRHDVTARHPLGAVVPHDALASLTEKLHASLATVTSDQHHAQSHNAASHSDIASTGAEIDDAVTKRHVAGTDPNDHAEIHDAASHSDIASSGADIDDAVTKKHTAGTDPNDHVEIHNAASHSDIASTGADIDDAVTKKHVAGTDPNDHVEIHDADSHSDIASTGAAIDAAVTASHAQAHDLASHTTKAHAELSDAPADAHHNESHDAISHSDITSTGAAIDDAVTKKHAAGTDPNDHVQGTDPNDHVQGTDPNDHAEGAEHSNLVLLETYTQTEVNIADAVTKKHAAGTDPNDHVQGTDPNDHVAGTDPNDHVEIHDADSHSDIASTGAAIDDAVAKKHAAGTDPNDHAQAHDLDSHDNCTAAELNADISDTDLVAVSDEVTKTVFIPALASSLLYVKGQMHQSASSHHGVKLLQTGIASAAFEWRVPDDFVSFGACKMVWSAAVGEGGHIYCRWANAWGKVGEAGNGGGSDTTDYGQSLCPAANIFKEDELADPPNMASLEIGDYVNFSISRDGDHEDDTVNWDFKVQGLLITYTGYRVDPS